MKFSSQSSVAILVISIGGCRGAPVRVRSRLAAINCRLLAGARVVVDRAVAVVVDAVARLHARRGGGAGHPAVVVLQVACLGDGRALTDTRAREARGGAARPLARLARRVRARAERAGVAIRRLPLQRVARTVRAGSAARVFARGDGRDLVARVTRRLRGLLRAPEDEGSTRKNA